MNKLLFGLLFVSTSLFAEVETPQKLSFLLPVDWTTDKHIDLAVSIPQGFKAIQTPDTWADATIIEFIPKGEDENNWSQIITINKFLGTQVSATTLATNLKDYMIDQSTNGTVLKTDESSDKSYKKGLFGLAYDYQDKHEVLGAVSYSGPADCVGVQYTIRPEKGASDKDTFAKIEKYFNESTVIIAQ